MVIFTIFKSPVMVLLFFSDKTLFPPWSSNENSEYQRRTKPKASMDEFFTIPLEIVFLIQMSGLLLLSETQWRLFMNQTILL